VKQKINVKKTVIAKMDLFVKTMVLLMNVYQKIQILVLLMLNVKTD